VILIVDNQIYRVEFHHKTKLGKRAGLRKAPLKAITTCVLVRDNLIAIENALCAESDNFCRRDGRVKAFDKLLRYCGALRAVAADLWIEYLKIDPPPAPRARKEKLPPMERERRKAAGQEGKVERRLERKLSRQRVKLNKLGLDKLAQAGKRA
jgi:hypothetical protein